MIELSTLDLQAAELLPAREALQGSTAALSVFANNIALALPEEDGDATANANQTLVVLQGLGGGGDGE